MKKPSILFLVLAFLYTLFHLLFYNTLEYHRDEMFYYVYGHHLAAGYATSPPLLGLVSFVLLKLFGYSLFAMKAVPALTGGVMVWLVAALTKELGGNVYARLLATIGFMISNFALRTFSLYMPVQFDILLWTLSLYILLCYINRNNPRILVWLGILAGLGMMNKYLIALLFVLLLMVIPFTKHRDILKKKQLYLGFAIGFIIFLPNIVWQVSHHFPGLHHLVTLNDEQLVHVSRKNFLMEQLLMPFMGSLLTVPGLVFLFSKSMKKMRWLGITCILVITVLFLIKGKHYYTLGVFPLMIAAGGVWWEKILKRTGWRIALPTIMVILTIPELPMGMPVFRTEKMIAYFRGMEKSTGIEAGRRFEDGTIHSLPQDYADMIGWKELADITREAWDQVEHKDRSFIYCENYGEASAIVVYGNKYGLPEPVSFHDSYWYWIPRSFDKEIESIIYINDEMGDDVKALFADIREIGRISNPDAREFGTTVYLCMKPTASFNDFWKERVAMIESSTDE